MGRRARLLGGRWSSPTVARTPNEAGATDAHLLEFYTESGNQSRVCVPALVIGVAGPAFIWYLAALCDRLAPAGADLVDVPDSLEDQPAPWMT